METKEYIVKVDSWGNYKKGDVLKMHPTTGDACIKYLDPVKKSKSKK